MVRWMCGVSLKDRKHSEDLGTFVGIHCVVDVVRHGISRLFGHLENKSGDDWMSSCRKSGGGRVKYVGRKTWGMCIKDDMQLLGLQPEGVIFKDIWTNLIWDKCLTLA